MVQSATNEHGKTLPVQVGIILCILVTILWWYLDSQRDNNLRNLIGIKANELSSSLKADIRSRVPSLQRIAQRWRVRGGTPKTEFLQDINAYLKDLPGFKALGWVDKSFHVRWIAPLKGNEEAVNLNLAFEKNRRIALELARDKREPTMTLPINLVQGGKGFIIYLPLFVNNEFDGFISAVFVIDAWIDYVFNFKESTSKNANFKISILINNENVYRKQGWRQINNDDWLTTSNIDVMEHEVSVIVMPTESFLKNNSTFIPEIISVLGIILSIIISIMIFLLQKTNNAIAKVRNINVVLEKTIKDRERAENEAKNASQMKSRFLSQMSHELRTPLNAVIGYSKLFEIDSNNLSEKQQMFIKEISGAGGHLLDLINDAMDLSKIESGKLEISTEDVVVNELLQNCFALIEPQIKSNNLKLVEHISGAKDVVKADYTRLKQVFLNILSNAVKYNYEGGSITINSKRVEGQRLRISIMNTGKGLKEEEIEELFVPFMRFDINNNIEGTGMGLTITKELVELMGGGIGVDSTPGESCTFWVELALSNNV